MHLPVTNITDNIQYEQFKYKIYVFITILQYPYYHMMHFHVTYLKITAVALLTG